MQAKKNDDINITRPELWTLQLGVQPQQLSYTLYSKAQDGSLMFGDIKLNDKEGNRLKAIEDAVYDNPFLLEGYGTTRIVVRSQYFMLMPRQFNAELQRRSFKHLYPNLFGEYTSCQLPRCNVSIGYEAEKGLISFLQRTFNNPPVYHHLYSLCEYFQRQNEDAGLARMYVNVQDGYIDVAVFNQGTLMLANTFATSNTNDALFYTLHAWQALELDARTDEIQLIGKPEARTAMAPVLRRYVNYVMPAIFPAAAINIGHNATKAPTSLILLAACE